MLDNNFIRVQKIPKKTSDEAIRRDFNRGFLSLPSVQDFISASKSVSKDGYKLTNLETKSQDLLPYDGVDDYSKENIQKIVQKRLSFLSDESKYKQVYGDIKKKLKDREQERVIFFSADYFFSKMQMMYAVIQYPSYGMISRFVIIKEESVQEIREALAPFLNPSINIFEDAAAVYIKKYMDSDRSLPSPSERAHENIEMASGQDLMLQIYITLKDSMIIKETEKGEEIIIEHSSENANSKALLKDLNLALSKSSQKVIHFNMFMTLSLASSLLYLVANNYPITRPICPSVMRRWLEIHARHSFLYIAPIVSFLRLKKYAGEKHALNCFIVCNLLCRARLASVIYKATGSRLSSVAYAFLLLLRRRAGEYSSAIDLYGFKWQGLTYCYTVLMDTTAVLKLGWRLLGLPMAYFLLRRAFFKEESSGIYNRSYEMAKKLPENSKKCIFLATSLSSIYLSIKAGRQFPLNDKINSFVGFAFYNLSIPWLTASYKAFSCSESWSAGGVRAIRYSPPGLVAEDKRVSANALAAVTLDFGAKCTSLFAVASASRLIVSKFDIKNGALLNLSMVLAYDILSGSMSGAVIR